VTEPAEERGGGQAGRPVTDDSDVVERSHGTPPGKDPHHGEGMQAIAERTRWQDAVMDSIAVDTVGATISAATRRTRAA
jgi:hypothetical protein